MSEAQRDSRQPLLAYENVEVWPIIHMIRGLTAPELTYTLIRPLEDKYNAIQRAGNKSIVFCFLLNRVYFIRDQNLITGALSSTRATLCELLAMRILRDNGNSMLDLVRTLTTSWPVWSGADPHVIEMAREERDDDLEERVGNAIEMAIISKARRFIKTLACQKVIDGIWIGKCVYQAESSHSILCDRYKRTPIHFYDPHKAPLLDHYRLKVPAIRAVLEYINFLILFVFFVVAIEMNERHTINIPEKIFMFYALGFTLEKLAAMQEHGIKVYFKGTWNGFDLAFVTAYLIYASFRIYGIFYHQRWARDLGIDFLAVIACLLFPRLAFVTLKNNLMVLSLRAMMMQFVVLMLIAAFCFCGFLYALWTLSRKGAGTIAWWMLDLWFGLDASGFDRAGEFDLIFGPILMIMYACLSNTLLLTEAILSNTFARINEDAAAEAMFRRAVSTIEGVKADSLFSYQPPINLFALCILLPLSYVLSPRWFHKVNVFLIRATNFPILLVIAWYERQAKKNGSVGFYDTISSVLEKAVDALPRPFKRMSLFEGLAGSGADIDVIFDIEDDMENALDIGDYGEFPSRNDFQRRISRRSDRPSKSSLRRPQPPSPKKHASHSILPPQSSIVSQPQPPAQLRPPSPQRITSHIRQSSAPIQLRRRVNSSLNKPDVVQSPLAQVFQPLMVDDEVFEDVVGDGDNGGGGSQPPFISYGPRRLVSTQSTPRHQLGSSAPTPIVPRRPFPVIDTRQETLNGSLSASPQRHIVTAEETEQSNEEEGGMSEWLRQMRQMEERQKRIESLLIQLTSNFQSQ
ncbi:hypothetical protein PAXRUDRAFT_34019 [Paxillus rubicundulus Ve08.2h10]|uniref:Receptor-activated Ca2+-permeable cation channel n=1 Tax=Paxillus rubicundulus Ve08.2h10 TaxID=930991 RepID=A0A0D0DNR3_9AGAM|nr:hypothetical protein PAXRUDRAFT_34019 [Paxillus rubicundulus Ve08.2h10]